jgi:hypothetical protein
MATAPRTARALYSELALSAQAELRGMTAAPGPRHWARTLAEQAARDMAALTAAQLKGAVADLLQELDGAEAASDPAWRWCLLAQLQAACQRIARMTGAARPRTSPLAPTSAAPLAARSAPRP